MQAHTYWEGECQILEEKLKISDCSDFLQWPFIINDMFHTPPNLVFDTLTNSKYWELWKGALEEDSFGKPTPYSLYPKGSGNLLFHAYSLLQLANFISEFNVKNLKSIYEFGGGYGSFCRMLHKMGFVGEYTIYDLPVFSKLQGIFLKNVGLADKKISLISDWPEETEINADLFVAMWSISESPIELRDKILSMVKSKYILITYREEWLGFDNVTYFKKFKEDRLNYTWIDYTISYLPTDHYLLGKKND